MPPSQGLTPCNPHPWQTPSLLTPTALKLFGSRLTIQFCVVRFVDKIKKCITLLFLFFKYTDCTVAYHSPPLLRTVWKPRGQVNQMRCSLYASAWLTSKDFIIFKRFHKSFILKHVKGTFLFFQEHNTCLINFFYFYVSSCRRTIRLT